MPRIKQQAHFRPGQGHQLIHVGRGFHIRAHVVVIRQTHAIVEQVFGKRRQFIGVGLPLLLRLETGAFVQGARFALDGVGHFAVHHDGRAAVGKQTQVRCHGGDLFFHRPMGQPARIPAGNTGKIVFAQHGVQGRRILWKLVAQLEPHVADLGALFQRSLQGRLAAQAGQIVVHPRDRVDADLDIPGSHLNSFVSDGQVHNGRAQLARRAGWRLRARPLPTSNHPLLSCACRPY